MEGRRFALGAQNQAGKEIPALGIGWVGGRELLEATAMLPSTPQLLPVTPCEPKGPTQCPPPPHLP